MHIKVLAEYKKQRKRAEWPQVGARHKPLVGVFRLAT